MTARRLAGILVVVALFMGVAVTGCGSSVGEGTVFKGVAFDGRPFDLAQYKGRPVVVNFWASWCGWCAREMPDLVRFAAAHPEIAVIGVDVRDEEAAGRRFAAQYGITYLLVRDTDGRIFESFESQGLPTTVFFDSGLNVKEKIVGATDLEGFEAGLRKVQ